MRVETLSCSTLYLQFYNGESLIKIGQMYEFNFFTFYMLFTSLLLDEHDMELK